MAIWVGHVDLPRPRLFNNLDVELLDHRFNVWHADVDERFGAGVTTCSDRTGHGLDAPSGQPNAMEIRLRSMALADRLPDQRTARSL